MNKKDIYFTYATLPEEDGTFADYFDYFMQHPQKDEQILIRACKELSAFVGFCMNVCTFYKSKKDGEYRQIAFEDDELDYDDMMINLFWDDVEIYNDTDLSTIDYPNIKGLVKMSRENNNSSYRGIFKRLLRGEFYLNEKELDI
ncbi:hypothetical protein [Priestia megaterium]|uniref:hypothetical protein n=1 Tax=Priestia megaterium TaxID=1404 RepID=UPI00112DCA11|nr:hypothetical protein [Priestia megaterium]TPF18016.1 hypothetical protein CBE78_01970 [Priestia megaterium]TPF22123.1 hypothetical protein CBE79_04475 [Priestia megaterium]